MYSQIKPKLKSLQTLGQLKSHYPKQKQNICTPMYMLKDIYLKGNGKMAVNSGRYFQFKHVFNLNHLRLYERDIRLPLLIT